MKSTHGRCAQVLAKYWVPGSMEVPVTVKAKLVFHPDVGKLEVPSLWPRCC